ncbi:MAG: FecR protein [Myxococcales bacterium]|nr:FecR protein [Myxococcales bacterium]
MNRAWEDPNAQELVRRAARLRVGASASARARVWSAIEERRTLERDRPARRRIGWLMFGAGAAFAAAIAFALVPRSRASEMTISASAEAATLDLAGEGRVVAGPGTLARLSRDERDHAVRLTVEKGTLLAHVKPRPKSAPFVIETPAFTARVVGTVLRIAAYADGRASIVVGHGAVLVTPRGGSPRVVRDGERWPADSTDAPSKDELSRMGAADLEGTDAAAFAPPAPSLPSPTRPIAPEKPGCAALHGEEAITCWLRVADEADPLRAETALYQAGWIRMHELGDAAFALGIWERQRSRFPQGLLRDEAQTSIIDALVQLHRTRAAETEIADYLRTHPHGLRSSELHFVRATLVRANDGDCRRARHEFDLALAHPAAPWASRARAARATCQ